MGRFDRYKAQESQADRPGWIQAGQYAIGFLTTWYAGPPQLRPPHRRDIFAFLGVGLSIGCWWALLAFLVVIMPNPVVAALLGAALIMGADMLITGGMHADGLADVADGMAAKRSGADVRRAMEDSAAGAVGASYLTVAYSVRFGAISAAILSLATHGWAVILIAFAPLLARAFAALYLNAVPPTDGGLSDPFRSAAPMPMAITMAALAIGGFGATAWGLGLAPVSAVVTGIVVAILTSWLVNRLGHILDGIGGGDICGTGIVIAETLVVMALAVIGQLGPTLP